MKTRDTFLATFILILLFVENIKKIVTRRKSSDCDETRLAGNVLPCTIDPAKRGENFDVTCYTDPSKTSTRRWQKTFELIDVICEFGYHNLWHLCMIAYVNPKTHTKGGGERERERFV